MSEIKNLKTGDLFSLRKNGATYEFLGYCPIENLPSIDLTDKLKEVTKYIKPRNLSCYVLVGFNSTIEQDMYRLNRLKELGISPFVQPYRDFNNNRKPTLYEKDIAQWANKHQIFKSCDFADFSPRKGFKCEYYLKQLE